MRLMYPLLALLTIAGCVGDATAPRQIDPIADYSCTTTYTCDDVDAKVYTFTTGSGLDQHEDEQRSICQAFELTHCAGTSACDVDCLPDPR